MTQAEFIDAVLTRWPGYTISTLLEEDAFMLMRTLALLDPDLGKATDG